MNKKGRSIRYTNVRLEQLKTNPVKVLLLQIIRIVHVHLRNQSGIRWNDGALIFAKCHSLVF